MAAQYHSKICAHAHLAMEELFGAGLIDPQSMVHFNALCRTDAASPAQKTKPVPPWLAEHRQETDMPKKTPAPKAQAATKVKSAPQPARPVAAKAPTASASHAAASGSTKIKKDAPRAPQASAAAATPALKTRAQPKAVASAQPAPRLALPKTDAWQFSDALRTTQSAALAAATQPAPVGAFTQQTQRHRSAFELRALREREGVSEAVFARCLGVPPQTVIAWESGIVVPSPKVSRLLTAIDEKGLNTVG